MVAFEVGVISYSNTLVDVTLICWVLVGTRTLAMVKPGSKDIEVA